MKYYASLVGLIAYMLCISTVRSIEVPGALSLESLTFDKVVKAFKVALVKFDKAYAYGETQKEFETLAKLSAKNENIIVAEVGVNEYGEKENQDLAERYKIKAEDFPQYRLFKGDVWSPVIHEGEKSHFDLVRFLRKNGVYIPLDGCMEKLDQFAAQFVEAAGNEESRNAILETVRQTAKAFTEDEEQHANIYLTLMKIMVRQENDFIQKSIDRMISIIEGNRITEKQKETLEKKVNVLKCFLLSTENADAKSTKDEL